MTTFVERILTSFPLPSSVLMPAVGIDISDRSVKFIELIPAGHAYTIGRFATIEIPEGVMVNGQIVRKDELVKILAQLRETYDLEYVRASLPEEPGYIFTTNVPDVSSGEIRSLLAFKLEEFVPLTPAESIIDFDDVKNTLLGGQRTVAVSVFPQSVAREYVDMLSAAGLTPLSLEIEAQAVARAIVPAHETGAYMEIDMGAVRSGIAVVGGGAVRFTTTIPLGGDILINAIRQAFPQATPSEIVSIQNVEGLSYRGDLDVQAVFEHFATELTKQLERYFLYWQTRKDATDAQLPTHAIEKLYLSGGCANIAGLPEYISRQLRIPVERANVWTNVCSIQEQVPPISYEDSLSYAAAIGLALHKDN